ncbi:hypothetical protein Xcel_0512 [Xylanimonas cellulosilytica DSM 15894]|uniref:Uncharacterized protein n=1 Tax=Xylanimonas cellulosilytica (strain DSM 15894 / JCM 12276 / CECT 5975 / KCTC 9989 / LMG 20990 / NBRC 107835 / XIL07) TaxID=446471 RepID=D1BW48_XYLCX|nr:hypothetical protein [Xylanimonas cellulosilytica]ACZ29551.1 hypothetical protein Xcel_0512 [Xylanimonas cellulosilytica DSM 15894]
MEVVQLPSENQARRKIRAARAYIETLRRMHPDADVLRSLDRQERELDELEAMLDRADDIVRAPSARHLRETHPV